MSTDRSITDATFISEVLEHRALIVVDFWAPWCGPCRSMSPVLDKIAQENAATLSVVKLNVDNNPETVQKYGVTSLPTILVFRDGVVVKRVMGARPKSILDAELAEFL